MSPFFPGVLNMFAEFRMGVLFCVLGMGTIGCVGVGDVRYVYQDGHAGVVGLPENTSRWPTYYRKHAEELMAQHFPEGYEIVRAEEVEEGSRTLTVNGTHAAELDAASPRQLVSLGKLGRTSSRTQSDTLKIRECRIVYKKIESNESASKHDKYAEQPAWTPTTYVDPNAKSRQGADVKHELATKPDPAKGSPVPSPNIPAPHSDPLGKGQGEQRLSPAPPSSAAIERVI